MGKKQKVILSLGANENQESNMQLAQYKLERLLSNQVIFSETMWTTPIGIDSDRFLNCLAVAHTHHSFTQLHRALKQIERSLGSLRAERKRGVVKMDIDILLFGDSRYHTDDWQRNYVRRLLERMGEKTSVEN
jgi:7,8-dihydro-6-hydroxymethylpterin-pyrophosphokinase (HPPK)